MSGTTRQLHCGKLGQRPVLFNKNLLAIRRRAYPLLPPINSLTMWRPRFGGTASITDQRASSVHQMLAEPEENQTWVAGFEVDLAPSRAAKEGSLRLRCIATL